MSKVNLPGFTAEASLYKTSGHYQIAGIGHRPDGVIYPAQQPGFSLSSPLTQYILRCMRFGYRCDYIWDPTHGLKVVNCGYRFYFVC